jgi:prepilin-type processing-associated H-X9-DG protein
VTADFSKPDSILAGDRNLACNPLQNPTILRTTSGAHFWWTTELHALKGNMLFSDGHVEQWNNYSFSAFTYDPINPCDLFLPTVK